MMRTARRTGRRTTRAACRTRRRAPPPAPAPAPPRLAAVACTASASVCTPSVAAMKPNFALSSSPSRSVCRTPSWAVAAEPQQGAVQRGVRPDHAEVLAEAVHKRQLAQRARVAAPLRSTPPSSRTAIASRRRRAVVRSRHHLAGQGRAPSESPAAYCTVPLLASRLSSSRSSCPPPPPPPSAPARAAMALIAAIAAIAVPSRRRGP